MSLTLATLSAARVSSYIRAGVTARPARSISRTRGSRRIGPEGVADPQVTFGGGREIRGQRGGDLTHQERSPRAGFGVGGSQHGNPGHVGDELQPSHAGRAAAGDASKCRRRVRVR